MPILHGERHVSRPFDVNVSGTSLTVNYFVSGTMDENVVYLTALNNTPTIADNLVRAGIKATEQGGGNWYVEVDYRNIALQQGLPTDGAPGGGGTTTAPSGPSSDAEPLPSSITFDTTGGTENIKISFGTTEKKSASGHDATDFTRSEAATADYMLDNQRAINATREGVAGVDRSTATFRWSIEVKRDNVDKAYMRTLRNMTYKVNDATWFQWPRGDVLYRGASGRQIEGRWSVTHNFEVNETKFDVEVGNGITLEKVEGWEYIAVEYMKVADASGLHIPQSARVEIIYPHRDFELIGIGV